VGHSDAREKAACRKNAAFDCGHRYAQEERRVGFRVRSGWSQVRSIGWLGSRVVSVLDSGAEGPGFKSQVSTLSSNSYRQTVHTHRSSVHQAAKLVAALLRVAGATAGLAESNGSLPPGL